MNFQDKSNRKTDYTDKQFAKKVCRFVYYLGMGDCWYEPVENPIFSKKMYTFWCFLSNFYILSVIFSELLANFRKDLNVKEQNDALQFSVAHPTIYLKFVSLMVNKDKIREFFKTIIEDTRNPMTSRVEEAAIKKSKIFIGVLAGTMFFCLSFTTLDGVRTHFKEGIPIRTLVAVWPGKYESGALAELVRFLVQAMWWWLLTVMVAIDGVCVTGLIFLAFRFRALQLYFISLREKFVSTGRSSGKTQDELELELRDQVIQGIKLHSKLLWCARSLQNALGNVYSVQLVQSIALIASCMIKLVRLERNLSFLFANFAFISGMIALTGTYMMAGGDVTYEASLLSAAMYDSGWEWCSKKAQLRTLLVIAIQCSERPVIMTAFGIYDLSYRNFISVVRTSYSFFAVMY